MKNVPLYPALLVCTIIAAGCHRQDDTVMPSSFSPVFHGRVINAGGVPVEGAEIHYIYSMTSSHLAKIQKPCPSTIISFSVPTTGPVSVSVLRWFICDTIAVLMRDTVLQAGTYGIPFNAASLTNGVYLYRIAIGGSVLEKKMLMLQSGVSDLIKTTPLYRTNASGEFTIPYGLFGFGVPFQVTDETGSPIKEQYISTTVQLIAFKTGYTVLVQPITIDTTIEMTRTLSFQ